MTYQEAKELVEKRFGYTEIIHNGFEYCAMVYSKNGKKILDTKYNEKWNEQPIAIAVESRFNDYVETDEPIEPIEEVEPIEEEEV